MIYLNGCTYYPNNLIRTEADLIKIMNFGSNKLFSNRCELNLSPTANLTEAAKNFFDYLHQLDRNNYKGIAVAPIPNYGLGKTINDRLKRAILKK